MFRKKDWENTKLSGLPFKIVRLMPLFAILFATMPIYWAASTPSTGFGYSWDDNNNPVLPCRVRLPAAL